MAEVGRVSELASVELEDYLTPAEAAKLLRISERALASYVNSQGLPTHRVRLGGGLAFLRSEILAWRASSFTPLLLEMRPIVPPESPGVYAVMGVPGYIKIGSAQNIARRVLGVQTGHPEPLRLLAVLSDDPTTELRFHWRFRKCRTSGEWFRVSAEIVSAIRTARSRSGL